MLGRPPILGLTATATPAIAEDVMVPLLRVVSYTPAWEGLVGNVVFHGIVVSEYITIAHRRNLAGAA